jgi:hypothetical protein
MFGVRMLSDNHYYFQQLNDRDIYVSFKGKHYHAVINYLHNFAENKIDKRLHKSCEICDAFKSLQKEDVAEYQKVAIELSAFIKIFENIIRGPEIFRWKGCSRISQSMLTRKEKYYFATRDRYFQDKGELFKQFLKQPLIGSWMKLTLESKEFFNDGILFVE